MEVGTHISLFIGKAPKKTLAFEIKGRPLVLVLVDPIGSTQSSFPLPVLTTQLHRYIRYKKYGTSEQMYYVVMVP